MPGAQRASGEREADEATGAGTPLSENFGFGCKSDGKRLQGQAGEEHELALSTQPLPLSKTQLVSESGQLSHLCFLNLSPACYPLWPAFMTTT